MSRSITSLEILTPPSTEHHEKDKSCPQTTSSKSKLVIAIGIVAVVLNIVGTFPLLFHVYRTKSVESLDMSWLWTVIGANVSWFLYGLFTNEIPVVTSGLFFVLSFGFLLVMKFRYNKIK